MAESKVLDPRRIVSYSNADVWEAALEHARERAAEEGEPFNEEKFQLDYFDYEMEWEWFLESLGEAVEEMGSPEYWLAEGRKMTWRNLSGWAHFVLDYPNDHKEVGSQLVRAISPKTDCTYRFKFYPDHIEARISHHDSPTGEFYDLYPMKHHWDDVQLALISIKDAYIEYISKPMDKYAFEYAVEDACWRLDWDIPTGYPKKVLRRLLKLMKDNIQIFELAMVGESANKVIARIEEIVSSTGKSNDQSQTS